jgi:O-antigen/teichoic acid export membrane protein
MNYYALVSITEAVLKLGAVLALVAVNSDKLIAYSALILGVTVIVRLMYALYCHFRLKDCRYERCFDTKLLGQFASYSGYSLLTSSADGITMQSRNIFFNWFTGVLANAAMGVANQVINVINGFVDTFTKAISPQIIKSYASGNRSYFMRLIFSSAKLNYLLFALICFPVVLNMDFLLGIWLGEYPPYAGPFILAILLFTVFDVIQQPLWTAIYATGDIKVHEILMSSIKILVIPATYFALKSGLSPVVTLYIWAGFNVICAVVRTVYAHFLIDLSIRDYLKKVILPIILVTLLSIPLPLWLSTVIGNGWIKLLVTGILSVIAIGLSGYLVGLDSQERVFVSNLGPVKKVIGLFRHRTTGSPAG